MFTSYVFVCHKIITVIHIHNCYIQLHMVLCLQFVPPNNICMIIGILCSCPITLSECNTKSLFSSSFREMTFLKNRVKFHILTSHGISVVKFEIKISRYF